MAKKDKKKNIIIGILLSIVVLGLIGLNTPIFGNILSLFKAPKTCDISPYDKDCYCIEGQERITVPNGGQWLCESTDKAFYVDEVGWETSAITAIETKLSEQFPMCDMATCNKEETSWVIGTGYLNPAIGHYDQRQIYALCRDSADRRYAELYLDVTTGAASRPWCVNYDDVNADSGATQPAEILANKQKGYNGEDGDFMKEGYFWTNIVFSSSCSEDTGKASITIESPTAPIEDWYLWGGGYTKMTISDGRVVPIQSEDDKSFKNEDSYCKIVEETDTYATIECDRGCPHQMGINDFTWSVIGLYDYEYWDKLSVCKHNDDRYFEGELECCNDERSYYICAGNEEWIPYNHKIYQNDPEGSSCYKSSGGFCPEETQIITPSCTADDGTVVSFGYSACCSETGKRYKCNGNNIWIERRYACGASEPDYCPK